ncbi:glutamyl-tRNA synthetase [Flagelloscypha sp. PMI_526]|nr:glutamyl-tRNA synthetase [Flagelloscypha sp. PMI_526]
MALYNYLFARKHGGKWILRIEDTDRTRYVPGSVQGIQDGLRWAGLDYDYGPGREGNMGPFYQSERLDLYRHHSQKLLETGYAYRCFCSPNTLAEIREGFAKAGKQSSYDKRCLHLTDEEVARRVRAGEKFTIRLNDSNVPSRPPFTDLVFGHVRDSSGSVSTDPVLLKSDSFPTYHLASVVDDHEMKITHVLRGEEWLPSLALHLNIYAALGIEPPKFAHIPILLNQDRTKMSKRHGDVQVVDYQNRGWEPSAVLNWLALSGWGGSAEELSEDHERHDAPDSTAFMTMEDMLTKFDLSVLTPRSNVLDAGKLEYLNKQHLFIKLSTPDGLERQAQRVHQQIKDTFPTSEFTTVPYIGKSRLTNMNDISTQAPFMFTIPNWQSDEAKKMVQNIPEDVHGLVLDLVQDYFSSNIATFQTGDGSSGWEPDSLRKVLQSLEQHLRAEHDVSHRTFMTVLRHALCGMKDGPSLVDVMTLLGYERVIERLSLAQSSSSTPAQ